MRSINESKRRVNNRAWWLGCLSALLLCGCAYRLGPTNGLAPREKSVQVTPFVNQTLQPRLSDDVTLQLRKELQKDGTYELASHGDGDIVVSGVLLRYERHELSLVAQDLTTARDFRITLKAQVTALERSSGKVIFDREVNGYTIIRVGSDLTNTERQAAPLLAQDLARQVTALLADGSW